MIEIDGKFSSSTKKIIPIQKQCIDLLNKITILVMESDLEHKNIDLFNKGSKIIINLYQNLCSQQHITSKIEYSAEYLDKLYYGPENEPPEKIKGCKQIYRDMVKQKESLEKLYESMLILESKIKGYLEKCKTNKKH